MTTWDQVNEKNDPIAEDEILLIDTEDSRNQKRALISSVQQTPQEFIKFKDETTITTGSHSSKFLGNLEAAKLKNVSTFIDTIFDDALDFAWSQNGLLLNVVGSISSTDQLVQFTVTKKRDPTTIVSSEVVMDFSALTQALDTVTCVKWNSDETIIFFLDETTNEITSFDVTVDGNSNSLSNSSTRREIIDLDTVVDRSVTVAFFSFSPDDKKIWVSDRTTPDSILQIDLPDTSSNLSTAEYNDIFLDVSDDAAAPLANVFTDEGRSIFVVSNESNNKHIAQYDMVEGEDIANAEFIYSTPTDFLGVDNPVGIYVTPDNSEMQLIAQVDNEIQTFDLGILSKGNSVFEKIPTVNSDTVNVDDTIQFADDSTLPIASETSDLMGDIETIKYAFQNTSIGDDIEVPKGFDWSKDGLTLNVIGEDSLNADVIFQYTTTKPHDISPELLSVGVQTFDLSTAGTTIANVEDFKWSDDGSIFFVSHIDTNKIDAFSVATNYDTTAGAYLSHYPFLSSANSFLILALSCD